MSRTEPWEKKVEEEVEPVPSPSSSLVEEVVILDEIDQPPVVNEGICCRIVEDTPIPNAQPRKEIMTYSPVSPVRAPGTTEASELDPSGLLALSNTASAVVSEPREEEKMLQGGIAWLILKYLYDRQRLHVSAKEFDELLMRSPVLLRQAHMVPAVIATVHTLAGIPDLRNVFLRWLFVEPALLVPDLSGSSGLASDLQPWEENSLWSVETWSLALEIIMRLLAQDPLQTELAFIDTLSEVFALAGPSKWKIGVITATLFTLRRSPWFWPMLL